MPQSIFNSNSSDPHKIERREISVEGQSSECTSKFVERCLSRLFTILCFLFAVKTIVWLSMNAWLEALKYWTHRARAGRFRHERKRCLLREQSGLWYGICHVSNKVWTRHFFTLPSKDNDVFMLPPSLHREKFDPTDARWACCKIPIRRRIPALSVLQNSS